MLTIDNFNQSDKQKIDNIPKSFKVIGVFYFVVLIPISFLFGLLGLAKKGHGYWLTTLVLIIVFTLAAAFSIIKDFLFYRKDKVNQKKYTGTITVIGKSQKQGDKTIFIDSSELKKINLLTKDLFNKIDTGDILTIEISLYTKTLFRLEKYNTDLLNSK